MISRGWAAALSACVGLFLLLSPETVTAADGWKVPDIKSAPAGDAGKPIRDGEEIIENTFAHIGPELEDPAKRFAGSNMACSSCHLRDGAQAFAFPLAGTAAPVEDKINACITRNMNGRALPADSDPMKAMVAYIGFLGSQMTADEAAKGRGHHLKVASGDPAAGRKVYGEVCMVCHAGNGLGKRVGNIGDHLGYRVPPVWGKDSFPDSSSLMKLEVLANFVHDNMPDGATWDQPSLSPTDAINAAAFLLTAPRPHRE